LAAHAGGAPDHRGHQARRIGLLLPAQLKELRERYDYTQKEMGELFQVGEKSWTRWESGRHRPSRSINLLIRALYEGQNLDHYLLKRAGKPACEVETVAKMETFPWLASASLPAEMAYFAHCLVASGKVIHFHSKGHGKSAFLKALSSLGCPPILSHRPDDCSRCKTTWSASAQGRTSF